MTTPVKDWATDYDIFDSGYAADPFGGWDELRQKCPVAHTDRWGGSWLPTRYEDVFAIARDFERFSSTEVTVAPTLAANDEYAAVKSPPISSDPPELFDSDEFESPKSAATGRCLQNSKPRPGSPRPTARNGPSRPTSRR